MCVILLGSQGEPISWPFLVAQGCLPFVAHGLSFHYQQHPSHLSLLPSQSLLPPSSEGPYDDTEAIQATQDNLTTSNIIKSAKPLVSCQVISSLVLAVSVWPSLGATILSTTQGTGLWAITDLCTCLHKCCLNAYFHPHPWPWKHDRWCPPVPYSQASCDQSDGYFSYLNG